MALRAGSAAVLVLVAGSAVAQTTVALGPTTPAGTNVSATSDGAAQSVAAAGVYTVAGYDGTDRGAISSLSLSVVYRVTAAAPTKNIDTYQIDYSLDGTTWVSVVSQRSTQYASFQTATVNISTTSWTDIANLQVRCMWTAAGGADARAVEWDAAPVSVTYTPAVAPSAPGTPILSNVAASTVTASWTASGTGTPPISYTVQKSLAGAGSWTDLAGCVGLSATTCNGSGLAPNTSYDFRVIAANAGGSATSGTRTQLTLPDQPAMAAYTNVTGTTLTVNWTMPGTTTGLTYAVERGPSATGPWTGVAGCGAIADPTRTCNDSGLSTGTTYWYQVRATNTAGSGAWAAATSVLTATPPAAPGTPSAGSPTTSSLSVSWTASTGATSYTLEVYTDSGLATLFGTYAPTTNSQSVTGLSSNTLYWMRASATGTGGTSGWSGTGLGTTVPGAPGQPSFSGTTSSGTTVSWAAPSGNATITSYSLDRATDSAFTSPVTTNGLTGTSTPVSGLNANTTYWFRVRATNSAGTSVSSTSNSVTTSGAAQTLLATGTDPAPVAGAPLCPGGDAAWVGQFVFSSDPGADTVNALDVALGAGSGAAVALVEIRDASGTTLSPARSEVPAADTVTFGSALLPSPTAGATYRLYVTPKLHALAAAGSYSVAARVSAFTPATYPAQGTDTASTFTIDNDPLANATWGTVTPGNNQIALAWTNPAADTGAAVSHVVVLRRQASAVFTEALDDGGTPPGAGTTTAGGSQVVYSQAGSAGAVVSFTDGSVMNGLPYVYRVYVLDGCGNWNAGAAAGPYTPSGTFRAEGSAVAGAPMISIVNPLKGSTVSGTFRVQIRVYNPATEGGIPGLTAGSLAWSTDDGATWQTSGLTTLSAFDTPSTGTVTGRTYEVQIPATSATLGLRAKVSNSKATDVLSNAVTVVARTTGGSGTLLVRDNSSQLCSDCHALKSHTSETTSTSHGSWSTTCRDCHTPHGTTNIALIAKQITPPAVGASAPAPKDVVFYNKTGLANASYASAAANGPCQVCHTRTSYYLSDGTGASHYTSQCSSCHSHAKGLKATCTTCHGDEARTSASGADTQQQAAPPAVATKDGQTVVAVANGGAHVAHVNQSTLRAAPLACAQCHPWPNTHQDPTQTDVLWSTLATSGGVIPTPLAGAVTAGWTGTPSCTNWCHGDGLAGGGGTNRSTPPLWTGTSAPCGSCHGSPPPVDSTVAADHPQNASCSSCHGGDYAQASIGATSKATHIDGTVQKPASGCTACHGKLAGIAGVGVGSGSAEAAPGYDDLAVDTHGNTNLTTPLPAGVGAHGKHVRVGMMPARACGVCHPHPADGDTSHADGGATQMAWTAPANAGGVTPSYAAPTCTNYCHSSGDPMGAATPTTTAATWTSQTAMTCTSCHATTALATNAHDQHVTRYACNECHVGTTLDGASIVTGGGSHVNGTNDVSFDGASAWVAGGSYAGGQCSNVYCHSDGTDRSAPFTSGPSLVWTDTATCTSCHGGAQTSAAPIATGRHPNHVNVAGTIGGAASTNFECGTCHAATVAAGTDGPVTGASSHVDRLATVSFDPFYGGSFAAGATEGTGSCSSTYCHSSGQATPAYRNVAWNDPALGCNGCHGTGTSTGAPDYGSGGEGSATANSHAAHVTSSADCQKCHAGTAAASGTAILATSALHLDKSRDVVILAAYDANGGTGADNYDPATKTCSGVSCHGSGTPRWGGSLGCNSCHGNSGTPRVAVNGADANLDAAPPVGLNGETLSTTRAVGAHVPHVNQLTLRASALPCAECHSGATHEGTKQVAWGTLASTGGRTPTWNGTTCASTYCHAPGGAELGGSNRTPTWTSGSSQAACGTCHAAPPPVDATAADHPQNTSCAACHGTGYATSGVTSTAQGTHMNASTVGGTDKPNNGCTACHGVLAGVAGAAVANTSMTAAPGYVGATTGVDTSGASAVTVASVGAHDAHVRPSGSLNAVAAFDCSVCHGAKPVDLDTGHANGTVGIGWASPANAGGVTPSPTAFNTTWEGTPSCTNYCHSNANPLGGTNATPTFTWTSASNLTCSSCHATSSFGGTGLSSRHSKHVTGYTYGCDECHAATMQNDSSTVIGTPANHVNGTKDWKFSTTLLATTINQSGGSYSAYTCTSTYCHSGGVSTTAGSFSATASAALSWNGGTSSCRSCHGWDAAAAPTIGVATGSSFQGSANHAAHVANAAVIGTNYFCGDCHASVVAAGTNSPITASANHVNGAKNVSVADRGSMASTQPVAGSCSAVYCHSNGRDPAVNDAARYAAVTWAQAGTLECNGCHGRGTAASGAPDYADGATLAEANSHSEHTSLLADRTSCQKCHNGLVSADGTAIVGASHTNGARNVVIAAAYDTNGGTGADNYDPATKTCSGVSCHGSGTPVWGTNLGCNGCHGSATARTPVAGADANLDAAPPVGLNGETLSTTRAVGAHVPHVNQLTLRASALPCSECHSGATHEGTKQVAWGTLAATGGRSPTWNGTTCASTYCHAPGGAEMGGTNRTPTWTSGSSQVTCGTCHGATPPVDATIADHPQNTNCAACHGTGYATSGVTTTAKSTHMNASTVAGTDKPNNGCTACHGVLAGVAGAAVANTSMTAAPGYNGTGVDTNGATAVTVASVGAHDAHVRPSGSLNSVAAFDCSICHGTKPATGDTAHANATIAVGWASPANAGGVTPSPTAFNTTWEGTPSCTNYCHSNAQPLGGTSSTPTFTWTSASNLTCSSCHATSAFGTTNLSQRHSKHLTGYTYTCDECHTATMQNDSSSAIGTPANHVNGTKNVTFSTTLLATAIDQSGGTYTGTATTPNYTCASTYCHSGGVSTTAGSFSATASAALNWSTGTSTCRSCHGWDAAAAPTIGVAAGSSFQGSANHAGHVANAAVIGANYFCGDCHASVVAAGTNSPVTTYTNHVNGVKNVSIANRGTFASTDTTATCSATYCHSSGQATPTYRTISWTGAAIGCNGCHGTGTTTGAPDYADGATLADANSHSAHVSSSADCEHCHSGFVSATGTAIPTGTSHTNGARDVAILSTYDSNGATSNYNSSTKQCSGVTCHGSGTPVWGDPSTATCTSCHVGTGDTNSWNIADNTKSQLDSGQWTNYGHGSTTVNLAQGKTGIDVCRYCHDWTVGHEIGTNPFRLLGATGTNGAITAGNFNAATSYGNAVCWNCHATGSNGVDPDGSATAYTGKNGAKKINTYHYGADHSGTGVTGGQRCWDCHDPHGDATNLAMIGSDTVPNPDQYGLTGTRSATAAVLTTQGAGGYANTTSRNGICQVCHSTTSYWRSTSEPTAHNAGSDCMSCHAHEQTTANLAFAGKGGGSDCIGCHGATGQGSTRAVTADFGLQSHHVRTVASLTTTGAGTFSSTATGANVGNNSDCVVCHSEGQIVTAASADCKTGTFPMTCTNPSFHANGKIDLRDVDVAAPAADAAGTATFVYDKKAVAADAGAAASWNSGNQLWREWTSGVDETGGATLPSKAGLDRFCLNCHDADGAAQVTTFRLSSEGSRTASDPFWDGTNNIGNTYDQMNRADTTATTTTVPAPPTTGNLGHVIDIKSKVSGSPPAQGTFARHAIRGQSTSNYTNYTGNIGTGFTTLYDAGRFTSMGTDEQGRPNWNDASVMGCADCHTVDGANGASGNAHGSSSEYLLKDSSGGAVEGAANSGSNNDICRRCHQKSGGGGYDLSHTGGNSSDFNDSVAQVGTARRTSSTPKGSAGTMFGLACLNCHGGSQGDGSVSTDKNTFGWIHGTNQVFPTGQDGASGTRNAYRFMNGSSLRYYQPGSASWDTGAGTCYTLSSATGIGNCTQHNRGTAMGPANKRPLSY